jgi:endonuclease/exonuclease/phosphatase family metal-dependent hydrolase
VQVRIEIGKVVMERTSLRVMTYNVHRCVGMDGVQSPSRIARVIGDFEPDVVALQELDVGHWRSNRDDQPRLIAAELGMRHEFHPAMTADDEHYGDAVLSRHPMRLVRAGPLPSLPGRELRGAIWVSVECHGRTVQFVNTHLGLGRLERLVQVDALLGPEWLDDPACRGPRVLLGDFNAWPGSGPYRRLRGALRDAQDSSGRGWPRNTFPARFPLVRIDHVFHSPDLAVRRVLVPRTRGTRVASDHLPVLVEVALP